MVKVDVDVRFDVTPVEEWPEEKRCLLTTQLVSYVDRELTIDVERALEFIALAQKHELWRFINKPSFESLFESRDLTTEAIEQYRQGVLLLRNKGYAGPISKDQATKAAIIKKLRDQHPDWTQQQIADSVGVAQPYVNKIITKTLDSKESVIIPEHLTATDSKADFRKLPEELQRKVAAREISLNKAAIQSGLRKKKTPEELALHHFKRCDNRLEVLHAMIQLLDDFERQSLASKNFFPERY